MKYLFLSLTVLYISITNVHALTVNFVSTKVCYGEQTTLVGSIDTSESGVLSYNWDLDNDGNYDDATGKTIMHVFTQADTFLVSLKVITTDSNEYTITSPKEVVVFPLPEVNFRVDNLCEGLTATYIDQSTIDYGTIDQWFWDFNNDGVVDNIAGSVVNYVCGPASIYLTKLEVESDQGCRAFATKTTEVFHRPEVDFDVQHTCHGDNTTFTNNTSILNDVITISLWNFGDGTEEIKLGNNYHSYNNTGNYTVTLIATSGNNCKDTMQLNVIIYPIPNLNITGNTFFYEGESTTLTASGNYDSIFWSNGETTNSITVSNAGMLSAEVEDANGCKNSKTVSVEQVNNINIQSNILTPNNDGVNDYLLINDINAYGNVTLKIYNRWGNEVYSNSNYNNDWSGTYNGNKLNDGTYFYIIETENETYKGSINILN